jgi:squalene-associated FAD-dependent desaturase
MKVVVVGGGLAGIAAALELTDEGSDVVLLERRAELGGLTWSFQRNGLWFDNGQHVFLRCCTAYRAFLDRIDASSSVVLQDRLDVPVIAPGGTTASLRRARLPAPLHLGPALARYRHLRWRDRARAVQAALALTRLDSDDPANDTFTFGSWLAAHGQSPAAVERLWNLIARPTLNLGADEAALGAAVKVFRTGLLDAADAADIGWAQVPLVEVHGDPARRALAAAGVEVRTGVQTEAITVGDEVTVIAGSTHGREQSRRADEPERHRADAVVLAVPHAAAVRLLPADALPAGVEPARLGTSAVIDVALVLDRRVTDLLMAAGIGSLVQFVFDRTAAAGARRGQVLAVSLSAADWMLSRRPEELVRDVHASLAELIPGAAKAEIVDAVVTKERSATFRCAPGALAHRPGPVTRLPGVLLAGAWTATGWPATMEGAVRSGRAAAQAALELRTDTSTEEVFA